MLLCDYTIEWKNSLQYKTIFLKNYQSHQKIWTFFQLELKKNE